MPARGLRERFAAVHNEANEVSDMAVLYLARAFGVSVAGPARPPRGAAARLHRHAAPHRRGHPGGRVGGEAEGEPAQELPDQPRWEMLPEYYVFLAMRAYRKELISRSRLAECLGTTEGDTTIRLLRYVASVSEPAGDPPGAGRPHALAWPVADDPLPRWRLAGLDADGSFRYDHAFGRTEKKVVWSW